MHINSTLFLGLALVGCSSPQDPKLPGMSFTPHLESRDASAACGDDITLAGDAAPYLHYGYSYDAGGQLVHAEGVFAAGGPDDAIDYGYDGAGNFVHMLEAYDTSSSEIVASYDGANLTAYSWEATGADYHDRWDYAMSDFSANGPAREDVTEQGQPTVSYALAYDGDGRLVTATPSTGAATTYSYDDAAGTISIDTGSGAFTDVISYDTDNFAELSDVWDGSDANVIAGSEVYNWNGDALVSATYSSGTVDAPHQVTAVETDTVRYDCAAAKPGTLHQPRVRGVADSHAR